MKTILFQGDSITDCGRNRNTGQKEDKFVLFRNGHLIKKVTALGDGYPALVSAELESEKKGEYIFVNRGVSGNRVPDLYARIVRDIINVKPDIMSILIGVNDVWHGLDSDPNGTGKERFEKVYNILIEEIKEELPQIKIMIMEPFLLEGSASRNRENEPDRYNKFRKGVEEMAAASKRVAEKHGLKFIELQKVFDYEAENYPAESLLSDGVHPTAKGHELIKREWLKAYVENI